MYVTNNENNTISQLNLSDGSINNLNWATGLNSPFGIVIDNSSTYLYNKYKPGTGGVGASSTAVRRAKNRLATVCTEQKCFPCYMTLGQYSNYTHNPDGFIPCPGTITVNSVTTLR
jgi:hypothetical protein